MGRRKQLQLPSAPEAPVGDLVLLTRHGFANRIRSVASAWWLAAEVSTAPAGVAHERACGAQLEDLFDIRLQTGGAALRVNRSRRAAARRLHAVERGAATGDRELVSCYAPYGSRCELHSADLTALAADPAPVALLSGASVPATLRGRAPASRPPRRGNARAGSKAERLHAYEHGVDGRLRGAFYRALVPSAAVRGSMAPCSSASVRRASQPGGRAG